MPRSCGTGPRSTRRSRTRRRSWRSGAGSRELVWSFSPEPGAAPPRAIPAVTDESKALAKALKANGFRFVGPTTAYALMQAAGLVNDHVDECWVREDVEARAPSSARARLTGAQS